MNRIVTKSVQRLLLQNGSSAKNRRLYSSDSSSGMRNKIIAVAGTGVVVGSTLVYAKYDDGFRNQLNEYLPFMNSLLREDTKLPLAQPAEESFMKKRPQVASSSKLPEIAKQVPVPIEKPKSLQTNDSSVKENASETATSALKGKTDAREQKMENKLSEHDEFSEEEIRKQIKESFDSLLKSDDGNAVVQLGNKDHENEIRAQLKRQLYVINDYFQEQIILYKTELNRRSEMDIKDKVSAEKEAIANQFESSFRKLKQMESLLKVRDSLDQQEKAMKYLYLLGQSLTNLLEHNRNVTSNETAPLKIDQALDSIQKVVNENFPEEVLIKLALDALPEYAKKNGVYSEEDLIRRFNKVGLMANQVSLVGSEYSNLFDYIKSIAYSYVRPIKEYEFEMSLNPIQKKKISESELNGSEDVDPKQWDTYDIVKRVRLSIENHNLEQALRYANQLKGEPRKIAQDWIRDTKDHLEVKQAIQLVQTKIAALSLQQINVINQ